MLFCQNETEMRDFVIHTRYRIEKNHTQFSNADYALTQDIEHKDDLLVD